MTVRPRISTQAAAGVPFMLQNSGGAVTRAMVLHMMCAAPGAWGWAYAGCPTYDGASRFRTSTSAFWLRE
jgi:hypothetical protein